MSLFFRHRDLHQTAQVAPVIFSGSPDPARTRAMSRRRSLDHLGKPPTTVDRETVHVGLFAGRDDYVVHGQVHGDSDIEGALLIGSDGVWIGNITADIVVVKGHVEGNVQARLKLELRPGARVNGDLSSPLIAVAEGAVVQGCVCADSVVTRFTDRRTH
jgi:cytoskeletal protein CcmA (bactofilin family)